MDFIGSIVSAIQSNPLLTTVIGLGGAGIVTFWLKDVPRFLYGILKRELTTELTLTSCNSAYHDMMKWIARTYRDKNFRKLKLSNGQWGWNHETITSVGYGIHWIVYRRTLLMLTLTKESANQSDRDKDTLVLMKFGRSRKLFDTLIEEVQQMEQDLTKTRIYKMEGSWIQVKEQLKRTFDTIFIEQSKKDLLAHTLSDFINRESWYISHGIPYQVGILLYGPPGTGKTSLIKAIAGYLDYPIYYLSAGQLDKIENAMSTLPDKCIVVVEDIDSNFLTHSRSPKKKALGPTISSSQEDMGHGYLEALSCMSLSEVLNSLDGMFSAHGRILIATTNHIESLDSALLRPGRIDLQLEIGYVNDEILRAFMLRFFPEYHIDQSNLIIRPDLTVATLQNWVMLGHLPERVIELATIQQVEDKVS